MSHNSNHGNLLKRQFFNNSLSTQQLLGLAIVIELPFYTLLTVSNAGAIVFDFNQPGGTSTLLQNRLKRHHIHPTTFGAI